MCHQLDLVQLIDSPTRTTEKSATCIDHIFISQALTHSESGVLPSGISDHDVIFTTLTARATRTSHRISNTRNYKSLVESDFLSDLRTIDWTEIESHDEIETRWAILSNLNS